MKILYSNRFLKSLRKLPAHIQDRAGQKENIFKKYPFSKMLKTHKLHGKFGDCYAFSVDHNHRIIFRLKENVAWFIDIGTHSIYQ
jgi:mRNA-degrading endonuclease YafQ of YafQ-DinJ toxin-antitoxin module